MPNYWVVGATIEDQDHHEAFVRRGHWFMVNEKPEETAKRVQIAVGDRIAIKRIIGHAAPEIEIRCLGIVRDNDLGEARVYVDWVLPNLQRRVPSRGCGSSVTAGEPMRQVRPSKSHSTGPRQ